MSSLNLPSLYQKALENCVSRLTASLRDNLYSLALYGSAVRGNMAKKQSDLNLLLVLNHSTPDAHRAIAHAVKAAVPIRPMVICRAEMKESFSAFAVKFESIKRNYRLLHGADPFEKIPIDREMLRFLAAQSLRNLRLRCIYAYVTLGSNRKHYLGYLIHAGCGYLSQATVPVAGQGGPMDDAIAGSYPVRCPVCLHEVRVDKSTPFSREITCPACKRRFAFRDALPPVKEHTGMPEPGPDESRIAFSRNTFILLLGIPAVALSIGWASVYHQHLSGPLFLVFIAVVILITLGLGIK